MGYIALLPKVIKETIQSRKTVFAGID